MANSIRPGEHARRTAVITVSYGSGEALEVFLETLRRFHGGDVPVVVVDNKPGEEGVADLARRFGAEYVPLPSNPGYGAGMNAGVAALAAGPHATGIDAYFFCNPDLRFTESVIEMLAAGLDGAANIGSIGPRLLNDDGSVYPSARNIPSVGTGVGHALLGRVWKGNPWTRAYQSAADYDRRRETGWLSGAAVMVARDAYDRIGGWDEAYFMHFEDIDLGFRLGRAGFANVYEPAVAIEHAGAHSTRKHAVMVERAMTDSAVRFMGKRYAGPVNAPIRWALALGLRARGALKVAGAKRDARLEGTR